jgi:hypothetical protein
MNVLNVLHTEPNLYHLAHVTLDTMTPELVIVSNVTTDVQHVLNLLPNVLLVLKDGLMIHQHVLAQMEHMKLVQHVYLVTQLVQLVQELQPTVELVHLIEFKTHQPALVSMENS